MDSKKRQEIRKELSSQGYSWSYVDSWPAKVDMFAHRDLLNVDGRVAVAVGTKIENQPGHPDHAARKSRIGLLPWPPSETCRCRSCRERYGAIPAAPAPEPVAAVAPAPVAPEPAQAAHGAAGDGRCRCGWRSIALKKSARKLSLDRHMKAA